MPLIIEWEKYLSIRPTGSLGDFATWLLQEGPSEKEIESDATQADLQDYFNKNTEHYDYVDSNSEASYLLWRLNKFLRTYTKALFVEVGLSSQDEFAILAHVDYKKECSKKEAVEENLIDMSTGIDIIRRLIKRELLVDRPNKDDKRERLVKLTSKGRGILHKVYAGFASVQDILVNMDSPQRKQLINLLKKLDNAHTEIHRGNSK